MTAPRPILVYALAAAAVLAAIVSYGNARADNALAEDRRDQLEEAFAASAVSRHRRDLAAVARQRERDSLAAVIDTAQAIEDSLEALVEELEDTSEANLARLAAILDDPTTGIPDTVRIIVREAVAGVQAELGACQTGWDACRRRASALAADTALLRLDLVDRDSTIAEQDSLLEGFRTQLDDALRTSIFDHQVIRLGERGLAIYGLLRGLEALLGGGR